MGISADRQHSLRRESPQPIVFTLSDVLRFHRASAPDRHRWSLKAWVGENYVPSYRKWLDYVHGRRPVPEAVLQAIAWVHAQVTDRPLELVVRRPGFGTIRYADIVPVRRHPRRRMLAQKQSL